MYTFSIHSKAQSHFYPLALPLRVHVLAFSFGWRGRSKGKGQIALQTKIFRDHTSNEEVWELSAETWLTERTKRHINVSIIGINKDFNEE